MSPNGPILFSLGRECIFNAHSAYILIALRNCLEPQNHSLQPRFARRFASHIWLRRWYAGPRLCDWHKGQDPLVFYCASLGSLQMGQFYSPKQCLSQTTLLQEELLHCTRRYTLNVLERAVYSFQRRPKGGKMFVRVMDYLHLLNFGWRTTSSSSSYPKTNCIRAEFCVGPFVN